MRVYPVTRERLMEDLIANRALAACFTAWAIAQCSKLVIYLVRERQIQFRYLTTAGGMPSSHTAAVVALTTMIGIDEGLRSPLFALSLVFAAIVMYDATGVRRSVSIQARILNRLMSELVETQHFNERRLRELLGHTPFEVFVGAILGAITAVTQS